MCLLGIPIRLVESDWILDLTVQNDSWRGTYKYAMDII